MTQNRWLIRRLPPSPKISNGNLLDGTIKVNWDASINGKESCIGLGMVARDCKGDVLAAKCVRKNILVDPKTAKAMAALWAVFFAKSLVFLMLYLREMLLKWLTKFTQKLPFYLLLAI